MTDLIEQIITRALLEGCDNHKDRAALARETARQVMEGCRRQLYRLSDDGRVEPVPSYDEGIKEGLRRAAALVREKHIVHVAGAMDLLEPRWEGNRSGLAYADAIEALSLLPKEA